MVQAPNGSGDTGNRYARITNNSWAEHAFTEDLRETRDVIEGV
ncbi:MAG: hypothetical protein ACPHCN_04875 [Mycobacterium sp.]